MNRFCLAVTIIAVVSSLMALPAAADVRSVRLGIERMISGACGSRPHNSMIKPAGVKSIQSGTNPLHVVLEMEPGVWPDVLEMQMALVKSGFLPDSRDVRFTAVGTLRQNNQKWLLELEDLKEPTNIELLLPTQREDNKDSENLLAVFQKQIGQTTTIHGLLMVPAQGGEDKAQVALQVLSLFEPPKIDEESGPAFCALENSN